MMDTKDIILLAAIRRFNQLGTAEVSTNHIAKEAGISPGNLYYHYTDKAHIIRAIYERMIKDWETVYEPVEMATWSEGALQAFIIANFELLWRYRFFYRETVALLGADPILAERHFVVFRERFKRQSAILRAAVQHGVLRFPSGIAMDNILTIAWIVANHYLVHLESMGQVVEKKDFENGAALVLAIFKPYLQ